MRVDTLQLDDNLRYQIELGEVDPEERVCYRIEFVAMTLTNMGLGVGDSYHGPGMRGDIRCLEIKYPHSSHFGRG